MQNFKSRIPALHHDSTCPFCENQAIRRKKREIWMYLIPASRNYYCKNCKARFLQVAGRFTRAVQLTGSIRLPYGTLITIGVIVGVIFFYLLTIHDPDQTPSETQDTVVVGK